MTRPARARKQLGIPEPVLEFKVWPEDRKRKFLWTVKVFKTRGQMRRYLKYIRPERNFGMTYAFTDQQSLEIIFCLWTMTDNCVSHECFHAAMWWVRATYKYPTAITFWDTLPHERVAEAHGNMVSAIWEKFTAAGFKRTQCWGFEKGE